MKLQSMTCCVAHVIQDLVRLREPCSPEFGARFANEVVSNETKVLGPGIDRPSRSHDMSASAPELRNLIDCSETCETCETCKAVNNEDLFERQAMFRNFSARADNYNISLNQCLDLVS